jgi:chemotaxis signal transduction protein
MSVSTSFASKMPLVEFQKSLDAALQTSDLSAEAFIGVRSGSRRWLLPMSALEEVGLVQQVARLGAMPAGVAGLANFRGQPRTLIDASALLGDNAASETAGQWALIFREADLGMALLWPEVLGIFPLQEFPEEKPSDVIWVRALRRDTRGEIWEELDVQELLEHLRLGHSAIQRDETP